LRFLVTGASGFIGKALCRELLARGHQVLGIVRRPQPDWREIEWRALGEISAATDWSRHLERVEGVIHLAGRAHRTGIDEGEPAAAAALCRAAARAGARRFLEISSIKVMGEQTAPGAPFRPHDPPAPGDAYGRLKLAVERALEEAASAAGIERVILRPPLVYGPGVKGNFRALLRLIASGVPLPLAGIENRRSLIFVENLVDLTVRAALHPAAGGKMFLLRDGPDLSTSDLIRALAEGLGRKARLYRLPPAAFALARRLPGLGASVARLTSSLAVDDAATRALLEWTPHFAAEAGLSATARAFAAEH
jgi:nucleoside-diphosphate-sugar epimerase